MPTHKIIEQKTKQEEVCKIFKFSARAKFVNMQ